LEKAKDFYGNLFGWKINGGENKDWTYWLIDTCEKPSGGMWRFPKGKPLEVLVYISVDNIDGTLKKAIELERKSLFQSRRRERVTWCRLQTRMETYLDFIKRLKNSQTAAASEYFGVLTI